MSQVLEILGPIGFVLFFSAVVVSTLYVWTRASQPRAGARLIPDLVPRFREMDAFVGHHFPGDPILWEGRPLGYPPFSLGLAVFYVLRALAFAAALALPLLAGPPRATYRFDFWTVSASAPGETLHLAAPWLVVAMAVVLTGVEELRRTAAWHGRRFAVTRSFVIALDPARRSLEFLSRHRVESVALEPRALLVRGRGHTIRLEGIEDPEAARSALEAPDAGPARPEATVAPGSPP